MKNLTAAAALTLTASAAVAGGLDRSGQSTRDLFIVAGTGSVSFGYVKPSVTGTDALGNRYDVAKEYTRMELTYNHAISDKFAYMVKLDEPFGADVSYGNSPLTSTLGGTFAKVDSNALNLLGRYRINERVSVHGGVRVQRMKGSVGLNGQAYAGAISVAGIARTAGVDAGVLGAAAAEVANGGNPGAAFGALATAAGGAAQAQALLGQIQPASGNFLANGGYSFSMEDDTSLGYTIGASYEIPAIALRAVLSYHSEIEHSAATVENINGLTVPGRVKVKTPQSVNLAFETGIAADTLLIAGVRWVEWSKVDLTPTALQSDLVNIDDSTTWTLGVGRRINDNFSVSAMLSYEAAAGNDLVSPLGPNNGAVGLTLAGRYQKDNLTVTGGLNYTKLGDASASVAGQEAARFEGNDAVGIGFQLNWKF